MFGQPSDINLCSSGPTYVVVEMAVGDGDPVGRVRNVQQAVVVVLVHAQVTADVEVVEPDVGGLLDGDAVAALHLGELQVADDDVLDALDGQVDTGDGCYDLLARLCK
jgi:hypothetical protein